LQDERDILKKKALRIATVFFLAASLFAGGVTVANCRCDPGCRKSCVGVFAHETQVTPCSVMTGRGRQNPVHELGQCKGTGLCFGYLSPGKANVPPLPGSTHAIEVPPVRAALAAGVGNTACPGKPSPQYILNLSFLC